MKTNVYIIICFLIFLISCDYQLEIKEGNIIISDIKIEVTDSGFTNPEQPTKTSEVGYQTKFEKGDIVGVYIINTQSSQNNKENIPLTFDGVSWNFPTDTEISDFDNIQLFAYYPYDKSMSLSDLLSVSDRTSSEEFFAEYISCQTLVENQGEYEDYTKADIMVGKGSLYGSILKFEMKHQMSLMVIKLPNEVTYAKEYYLTTDPDYKWQRFKRSEPASLSNIQFTGFTPYEVRAGEYRYIVPSSHTFASNVSGSFEVNGESRKYSFTPQGLNKNEYKEYKITATIIEETIAHTLTIGDIYKSDGGLISQVELANPGITEEEKTECVGVVFQTYYANNSTSQLTNRIGKGEIEELKGKGVNTPHALVLALRNATNSVFWSKNNIDEPNLDNIVGVSDINTTKELFYTQIEGLKNCNEIWDQPGYEANYIALFFAKQFKEKCPQKTTGWFIPSLGQWMDIVINLGKDNLSNVVNSFNHNYYLYNLIINNSSSAISKNINDYIKNIPQSNLISLSSVNDNVIMFEGDAFWTSSEGGQEYQRSIWFSSKNTFCFQFNIKEQYQLIVRCILAF